MVLSKNVQENVKDEIMAIWGCRGVVQYEKYLSISHIVGRSRKNVFSNIKNKFWQCLQSWRGKLLSQSAKEVLLKTMALAISMLIMSCFKFSIALCKEIKSLVANFWWG